MAKNKNGVSKNKNGAALAKARAARSAQPKPPAWRANPAGHAAVKLGKYAGYVHRLFAKMKGFPFGTKAFATTLEDSSLALVKLDVIANNLFTLAKTGFKLPRGNGRGWTVEPGMRVFLKPEGRELIGKQIKHELRDCPQIDTYQLFHGSHLGNYYFALLFPDNFRYELFEYFVPGSAWNPSDVMKGATDW